MYKKDDNLNMKNYRPVSILPSMSKVLEKIMLHQMSRFLREILDPRIAAYYSCQDVLLKLVDDWKRALEKHSHVGAVLMDLSKAFDCLPHQLLVAKLKAYGVCGKSCALIWSAIPPKAHIRLIFSKIIHSPETSISNYSYISSL